MKVYFVRHGESEANVGRIFSTRGWMHPLTAAGREQARRAGEQLAGRGVVAIHHSTLRRAVETAQEIAEVLRVPLTPERALVEYDLGAVQGASDETSWEQVRAVEARWDAGDLDARMPGGESCNDIRARFLPFFAAFVARFDREDAAFVLVGHGGLFWRMLPLVLANLDPRTMEGRPLPFAGIVEAESRDGALWCTRWCGEPVG